MARLALVGQRSVTGPEGLGCRPRPTKSVLWLALALLLLAVIPIRAQEPDKVKAFVYSGQVFDGLGYVSVFYPPSVGTIYLLADQQNVLSPRRTLVYFWPLTNAYKADWSSMNQIVTGTLEILDGDEVVATIPVEPALSEIYSAVGRGSVVNLPTGRYDVRMRADDGSIVPGSRRKLVVFEARRRGLGYQIVPQEKWTRPVCTDEPEDVIYAREGTAFYLQPMEEREYNELDYARLVDPQSQARRKDRWTWVHVRPFEEAGNLILDFGGQTVEMLAKPYRVEQLPGPVLGYRVVDYAATEKRPPDLVAYQLFVDANHASYRLQLQDADGKIVFGSQRQVRRVSDINGWALYFLAGLPLTIGGLCLVSRHERLAASRKRFLPRD